MVAMTNINNDEMEINLTHYEGDEFDHIRKRDAGSDTESNEDGDNS